MATVDPSLARSIDMDSSNPPADSWYLDDDRFSLRHGDTEIRLGNTDLYRVCREFFTRRRRIVSHEDLREVLGKQDMTAEAVRQTVHRLREELRRQLPEMAIDKKIVTAIGHYRFDI